MILEIGDTFEFNEHGIKSSRNIKRGGGVITAGHGAGTQALCYVCIETGGGPHTIFYSSSVNFPKDNPALSAFSMHPDNIKGITNGHMNHEKAISRARKYTPVTAT